MKSQVDKWVVVNGKIYRLDRVLDNVYDALLLQRALVVTCDVHLTRTDGGKWAVYWRSKKEKVECTPKLPSVAPM
jgi:hypothetical protein